MKRRDFLGLFSAALVATKITSTGETVPTPTQAAAPLPTPETGVIGRKLYMNERESTSNSQADGEECADQCKA